MKAEAYKTLTNSGGIEIALNRSQDGVYYWFNNAGVRDEPKEAEIQYDQEGDPYFMTEGGRVEYLSEYLRTNI
jgi:hypothetical protein